LVRRLVFVGAETGIHPLDVDLVIAGERSEAKILRREIEEIVRTPVHRHGNGVVYIIHEVACIPAAAGCEEEAAVGAVVGEETTGRHPSNQDVPVGADRAAQVFP
jgi:hypothetical protein